MGAGKTEEAIPVNMNPRGEEGGWINWAEEVEETDPIGWYEYQEVEKKPAKAAVKKREVYIKKETTHPYQMRLGSYLALREGEEGMRRLRKMGIRTEQQLEEKYMEGIMAKLGVCQNSVFEKKGEETVQKFDIEKEGEEAVKKWITNWRSREKIESHYFPATGKTEYYVVLLAMSPVQAVQKKRAEKEKQESQKDTKTLLVLDMSDKVKGNRQFR